MAIRETRTIWPPCSWCGAALGWLRDEDGDAICVRCRSLSASSPKRCTRCNRTDCVCEYPRAA